jgi:hypothetical protein
MSYSQEAAVFILTDLLFITMALYGDSLDELNGYQTMKHH